EDDRRGAHQKLKTSYYRDALVFYCRSGLPRGFDRTARLLRADHEPTGSSGHGVAHSAAGFVKSSPAYHDLSLIRKQPRKVDISFQDWRAVPAVFMPRLPDNVRSFREARTSAAWPRPGSLP